MHVASGHDRGNQNWWRTPGPVDESIYKTNADNGSNFRIDQNDCQYIYNLRASALGVGTYRIDIRIYGFVVGSAVFALK